MNFSGRFRRLAVVALLWGVLLGSAGWLVFRPGSGVPITGPIQAELGGETAVVFPDGSVVYLRNGSPPVGGRLPASTWAQVRRMLTSGRLASEDETRGGCLDGGYFYGVDGPGLSVSWALCESAGGPSSPVRIRRAPTLSRVLTQLASADRHGLDPLPEPPIGPPARALTVTRIQRDQPPEPGGAPPVARVSDQRTFDVTAGGDVSVRDADGRVVGGRHLDRSVTDALRLLLSDVPASGRGPVALTCTTTRYSPQNTGPIFVPEHTFCQTPPGSSLSVGWRALNWLALFVDLALGP